MYRKCDFTNKFGVFHYFHNKKKGLPPIMEDSPLIMSNTYYHFMTLVVVPSVCLMILIPF
jgi:hypothetical protein